MRRWIMILLLLIPSSAFAWNAKGHRIVAGVAERRLGESSQALKKALKLLGVEHLADVAALPDESVTTYESAHMAAWHFVNIPNAEETFNSQRDCVGSFCVVGAINNFIEIMGIGSSKAEPAMQKEALIYLIHLMGDLHQPFHCSTGKLPGGLSDRNATFLRVAFKGGHVPGNKTGDPSNDNLHFVWDVSLIEFEGFDEEAFVEHLFKDTLGTRDPGGLSGGRTSDKATEAHAVAQDALVLDGTDLDETYMTEKSKLMDEQLLQAGLKLAVTIQRAFGSN